MTPLNLSGYLAFLNLNQLRARTAKESIKSARQNAQFQTDGSLFGPSYEPIQHRISLLSVLCSYCATLVSEYGRESKARTSSTAAVENTNINIGRRAGNELDVTRAWSMTCWWRHRRAAAPRRNRCPLDGGLRHSRSRPHEDNTLDRVALLLLFDRRCGRRRRAYKLRAHLSRIRPESQSRGIGLTSPFYALRPSNSWIDDS